MYIKKIVSALLCVAMAFALVAFTSVIPAQNDATEPKHELVSDLVDDAYAAPPETEPVVTEPTVTEPAEDCTTHEYCKWGKHTYGEPSYEMQPQYKQDNIYFKTEVCTKCDFEYVTAWALHVPYGYDGLPAPGSAEDSFMWLEGCSEGAILNSGNET